MCLHTELSETLGTPFMVKNVSDVSTVNLRTSSRPKTLHLKPKKADDFRSKRGSRFSL